jgi:hypothetical protein
LEEPSSAVESPFDPKYPAPPDVQWGTLLVAQLTVQIAFQFFFLLHSRISYFMVSASYGVWILSICLWIRRLNPKSKSIWFAIVLLSLQALCDSLVDVNDPFSGFHGPMPVLFIAVFGVGTWLTFVIRAELQEHYNHEEPVGLKLGPVMTFFFSYIYFQYHLCLIALKRRQFARVGKSLQANNLNG